MRALKAGPRGLRPARTGPVLERTLREWEAAYSLFQEVTEPAAVDRVIVRLQVIEARLRLAGCPVPGGRR